MTNWARAVLFLGAVLAIGSGGVRAQDAGPATGTIVGRVMDEDGRALAGAAVVVRAFAGGADLTATTGADGVFRFERLPRGIYRVEVSLAPFVTVVRTGLVVIENSTQQVDVTMPSAGNAPIASASPAGRVSKPSTPADGAVLVRLETSFGSIDLAIDTARAPITAANFLKYVDGGFYDGGRFHRSTRPDNYTPAPPNRPPMELIQGGINPAKRADAFPPIPLERTSVTGITHVVGVVSMARGTAADTATSDFFILLDDQPSLDFGGKRFDDAQGAAAFGRVVAGLEVVRTIQQQPVQGQNLTPPVPILRASRIR